MPPDITPDALRELLHSVLDERSRINADVHTEHHAWVQARIDREQARNAFWLALAAKSLPGMLWGLIAAAAGLVIKLVREHITWS